MKRFFVALVLFFIGVSCSVSTTKVSAQEDTYGAKTREDLERLSGYLKEKNTQAVLSTIVDGSVVKFKAGTKVVWIKCDDDLCNVAKVRRKEDDIEEFYVMAKSFK